MKIKSLFVTISLLASMAVFPTAVAAEKPLIESLTFSPSEVELFSASRQVKFEVVASHPDGIENSGLYVTLTNSRGNTLSVYLERQLSASSSMRTTFSGTLFVPTAISTGAYVPSVTGVKNVNKQKYQFESDPYELPEVRKLVGAEKSLLIRSNGKLDLNTLTFVGPSYDPPADTTFLNSSKFNRSNLPIWRVGETFDPALYFEMKVQNLPLLIKSNSPEFCKSDGRLLSLVKEGTCLFSVYTDKNDDYLETNYTQSVVIRSARIKPGLIIPRIENQNYVGLEKTLALTRVYDSRGDFVEPVSQTPLVCLASTMSVKIIAGGTCKLTYQTAANSTYLASDVTTVSFDILKDGQPVVAPTPVVTPTPTPTPTVKPVVKRTISCVKGTKTVKKTAVSPKCPKGYKLKK